MAQTETEDKDRLANAREQGGAQYESIVEMVECYRLARDVENNDAEDNADDHEDACRALIAEDGNYEIRQTDEDDPGCYWRKKDDATPYDDAVDTRYDFEQEALLACCIDNDLVPSEEDARRRIEEDALSIQLSGSWSPGDTPEADSYEILLCTGGPACRIVGSLSSHNEPDSANLEVQDWFTPWTEITGYGDDPSDPHRHAHRIDSDYLLEYARVFYFGG